MKTIGVLTSGGDAPGMNAAIRAVVRTACESGMRVMGIRRGYKGLVEGDMYEMNLRSVSDIIHRGGTMLYSARCPEFAESEVQDKAVEVCKEFGLEGIVTIGGDGTFKGARALTLKGIPCIGIPGTIDNDIASTEYTIGFDTAMNTAMEMVDRLRDTTQSHERCSVVEVMGRHAGHIALELAVANGAEAVLIPEKDYDIKDDIVSYINESIKKGMEEKAEKTGFSIPKPAITLCIITLVAGAALSGVYALTKDTIAAQKLAKEQESYKAVCIAAEEFVSDEAIDAAVAALGGGIYGTDFEKSYINKVMVGKAGGETVGYVISATSGDGFDGDIVMSIGLDLNGIVTGIEFTEISETAGMGMLVTEAAFKDQYLGDDVDSFVVNKAGGSTEPNQIDSVSGATISSRAVTNAVNAARDFFAANVK